MRSLFLASLVTAITALTGCVEPPDAGADHVEALPPAPGDARCVTAELPPRACTATCPVAVNRVGPAGPELCTYDEAATRLRTDLQCLANPGVAPPFAVNCYYRCPSTAGDVSVATACTPGPLGAPAPVPTPSP